MQSMPRPIARSAGPAAIVAITCPLTPETENLIDAGALPPCGACASRHVARGRVVVSGPGLALKQGRIAPRGLDGRSRSPSALLALGPAQRLLTPHTAGETQRYEDA